MQNSPMYTILSRLGKGGYGYVYRGIRTQANRKSFLDKPLNVSSCLSQHSHFLVNSLSEHCSPSPDANCPANTFVLIFQRLNLNL